MFWRYSGGTVHLAPEPALSGQLVGRGPELSRLISCAAEATAGHGQAVLIEGEPGIGKSALVRAACAAAADRGCQVFWGADDELGQALPLLPILDGLRVREPSANPRQETIVALLRGEVASGRGEDVLSEAIADRLRFVPSWVREVLRAAALLGVAFAVPDLATVLHRGVADLVPAVDEAQAADVLTESGTGLGFRHPMIRAALSEEIPAPARAAWHREAGRALAEAGAPADRVARQLLPAVGRSADTADPMDEWILRWLGRTAPLLVGQAPCAAAELVRQAVRVHRQAVHHRRCRPP